MTDILHLRTLDDDPAGGVIGGAVGDWAAKRYPAHGRVALCQLSVASGIPFCVLIFRVRPLQHSTCMPTFA